MAKYEDLPTLSLMPEKTILCTNALPDITNMDDPALAAMIDFNQTSPHYIGTNDLIDDALCKLLGHHLLRARLLVDGAVVAREVARVGEFEINDLVALTHCDVVQSCSQPTASDRGIEEARPQAYPKRRPEQFGNSLAVAQQGDGRT